MIAFARKGSVVTVHVDTALPVERMRLIFERTEQFDYVAELVLQRLKQQMEMRLRMIRDNAYEKGWRDAKSKKCRKETWFSCQW